MSKAHIGPYLRYVMYRSNRGSLAGSREYGSISDSLCLCEGSCDFWGILVEHKKSEEQAGNLVASGVTCLGSNGTTGCNCHDRIKSC